MKYFEDIQVGDNYAVGRHTFNADEIKVFARRFDPQLFHLDEAVAERSHFGALCASGWHTAVVWMRGRAASRSQAMARRWAFAISNGSNRYMSATPSNTKAK